MNKLTLILAAGLLTGCASVPSTKISLPTKLGLFQINSPKETSWTNVVFELSPDGTLKTSIGAVTAHNDANVIAGVAAANAQMADKLIQLINRLEAGTAKAVVVP